MLSRIGVIFGRSARTLRCLRYSHSSGPKLHDILEYWHKVKTGVIAPEEAKEYSDHVTHHQATGQNITYSPHIKAVESRSWSIAQGVMDGMLNAFKINNADCDTLFENADDDIMSHLNEFKSALVCCYDEHDFKKLEHEVAKNIPLYNLKDLVYCLDGFLFHRYQPKFLLSKVLKHMSYRFKEEEKTPSLVLHLMYIIGCSRDVPRELSGALENYVRDNRQSYGFTDFTVICFTFMVTNEPITDFILLDYMAKTTMEYFTNRPLSYQTFHLLVSMYKCFTLSSYHDLDFFMKMGDCIVNGKDNLPKIRGPQFNTVVHSYAAAGIKHDQLFKVLQDKVDIHDVLSVICLFIFIKESYCNEQIFFISVNCCQGRI